MIQFAIRTPRLLPAPKKKTEFRQEVVLYQPAKGLQHHFKRIRTLLRGSDLQRFDKKGAIIFFFEHMCRVEITLSYITDMFNDPANYSGCILEFDGDALSAIGTYSLQHFDAYSAMFLYFICSVTKGSGAGISVVNACFELARQKGCDFVYLFPSSNTLVSYYEKLGFRKWNIENALEFKGRSCAKKDTVVSPDGQAEMICRL